MISLNNFSPAWCLHATPPDLGPEFVSTCFVLSLGIFKSWDGSLGSSFSAQSGSLYTVFLIGGSAPTLGAVKQRQVQTGPGVLKFGPWTLVSLHHPVDSKCRPRLSSTESESPRVRPEVSFLDVPGSPVILTGIKVGGLLYEAEAPPHFGELG